MTESVPRQRMLAVLLAGLALLSLVVLFEVIGTVFLAVTVSYLLVPAARRLQSRGVPRRLASGLLTLLALTAAIVPLAAIAYILYQRRADLIAVLSSLPPLVRWEFGTIQYAVQLSALYRTLQSYLSTAAFEFLALLPILALKLTLFVFLLYVLLIRSEDAAAAIMAPVPDGYHDVLPRFHDRIRHTLYAIYVLQLLTAVGTFLLALPVLVAFGYPFVITIAFFAAVLQFVPIVGPSLVVIALSGWELSVGAPVRAVAVLIVGLVVIAGLPDILIRPRLAQETGGLSGGLYFVGFVGGILTIGPIGVVAGPLVVALVVESTTLLAEETAHSPQPDSAEDSRSPGTDN